MCLNVIFSSLIKPPLCFYCIPACWISASLPPPLHHLLCILRRPPRHSVQIYHTNTGQANDLPCSIFPQGPTATHNSPVPHLFQPLAATFKADWKYGWGVICAPLIWLRRYFCSIIVHCLGINASWVSRLQSEVNGIGNDTRAVMDICHAVKYRCKTGWRHGGF